MHNFTKELIQHTKPVVTTIEVFSWAKRDSMWMCRHVELRDSSRVEELLKDCQSVPTAECIVIFHHEEQTEITLEKRGRVWTTKN